MSVAVRQPETGESSVDLSEEEVIAGFLAGYSGNTPGRLRHRSAYLLRLVPSGTSWAVRAAAVASGAFRSVDEENGRMGSTVARRLSTLGLVDAELAAPTPVTETARPLSAPELVTSEPL